MHNTDKGLGEIIKNARLNKQFTQEQLAEKIGVGSRHIMAIENEGKSPSYEVLYQLIQVLAIPSDLIFHPGHMSGTPEQEQFISEFRAASEQEQRIVISLARSIWRELRRNDN